MDRVLAQYDARKTLCIEIPEWGEENKPLRLFYRAPTLAILAKVRKDSGEDDVKMMAMLVAISSLNEKGERLFTNMNWHDLFNGADPAVVQRIGTAIMAEVRFDNAAVEAAEKN
jgi:hypothetical protein